MSSVDSRLEKLLSEPTEVDLRLDREGRWYHEGTEITHPGLAQALHRWLDRDPDSGRWIVRSGAQWCFVDVEDAPVVVLGVSFAGEGQDQRVFLQLTGGDTEELDYATLRQRADNVLYCDVRGRRFPARFSRSAYFRLAETVVFEDDEPRLPAAGTLWPIASVE